MSLREIKDNVDKFDEKSKGELIRYLHELLITNKRQDSKLMGLQSEIKFMTRHLTKTWDLIDKILTSKIKNTETWKDKDES